MKRLIATTLIAFVGISGFASTTTAQVPPPPPNTLRTVFDHKPLKRTGPWMTGLVKVWPGRNIAHYVGTMQLVRVNKNGSVTDVGLEWSNVSNPARIGYASMGGMCHPNHRVIRHYKYLASFVITTHRGLTKSESKISDLYQVNC